MTTARNSAHLQQVRRGNVQAVLLALVGSPGSRAELAQRTGLTKATVATLVEPLISDGVLAEDAAVIAGRGRPSRLLRFHPEGPVALGVEIGVGKLAITALQLDGTIAAMRRVEVDNRRRSGEQIIRDVAGLIRSCRHPSRRLGVGIAVPGVVSEQVVVRAPNVPGLVGIRVAERIAELAGVAAVEVDNEAHLAAFAHLWPQAVAGDDYVYVSGDIGVGAGLVTGGALYRGASGSAGELGHITIERAGRRCACGRRGCVEQYAGVNAIMRAAGRRSLPALVSALDDGEPRATRAVSEAGEALGIALGSLLNVIDVPTVVLGGSYTTLYDHLAPAVRTEPAHRMPSNADVRLVPSPFGADATVRGAAALITHRACTEPDRLGQKKD